MNALGLLVYVDHVQEIFMATYENIREKKKRKMHAIVVKNRGNNCGKCEHLKKKCQSDLAVINSAMAIAYTPIAFFFF